MRIKIILSLAVVLSIASCAPHGGENVFPGVDSVNASHACRQALQHYMDTYPESQLRDLYKFCFQDYFGLEHILSDSVRAAEYITAEIGNAPSDDWQRPRFCYPLLDSNYYRVDIGYVLDGTLPVSTLVHAMMESARQASAVDSLMLVEWRHRWGEILSCLSDVTPHPQNFEQDSAIIDSLLLSGGYALHHSALFNSIYRQHYRIVHRDAYKSLIEPIIKDNIIKANSKNSLEEVKRSKSN